MIKFVLAAIWIAAVCVGSVFYSFQMKQTKDDEKPVPPFFGGLDYIATDIISVPVLRKDGVVGYFLARLVYTIEPDKLRKLSVPARTLIVDSVYDYLFANPEIDWSKRSELDLEAFKKGVRDSINDEVGEKLVHEVMIEQIDFLSKAEIRNNRLRRRIVPTEDEPPGADRR